MDNDTRLGMRRVQTGGDASLAVHEPGGRVRRLVVGRSVVGLTPPFSDWILGIQ